MPTLFLIVFVDLVGFGLVIPLLPFYALQFAASPQEVTVLLAIYSLMQLFTAPLWGKLSDRVGRRPVLMVSMAASVCAYLWIGSATALWMLFAARALAGACAGNIAAAQAYIADITKPEDRAKGMGLIGAAFGLGFIIGPALAGFLAGSSPAAADVESPAWVAAGLSFLALCGVVLILPESLAADRARSGPSRGRIAAILGVLGRPVLSRLILIFFLVILAFAGMESTFALWAIGQFGWGPRQVGFVFSYVGILSAMLQGGLIGRLARLFGEERLLIGGLALIACGLAVLPFARHLAALVGAVSALALGMGLMQPSLNSLISRRAGREEQGEVLGVSQSAGSLSRVLGPAAAGLLFGEFGRNAPFFWGAMLVAAAFLLGLSLIRSLGAASLADPKSAEPTR
ncbi:MAG: MFS transporter [Alphaproteobacteria bacterium]|nr:MFS transporter [Alphaproteobacteria bacterium]MBV9816294.1 MFS transporter [Alphaproteobacteria bacterium]